MKLPAYSYQRFDVSHVDVESYGRLGEHVPTLREVLRLDEVSDELVLRMAYLCLIVWRVPMNWPEVRVAMLAIQHAGIRATLLPLMQSQARVRSLFRRGVGLGIFTPFSKSRAVRMLFRVSDNRLRHLARFLRAQGMPVPVSPRNARLVLNNEHEDKQ